MRSFSTTYTFKLIDKNFHMISILKMIPEKMMVLTTEDLRLNILYIERHINISIKKAVITDFNSGYIVVYITDNDFIYPATTPIVLTKRNDFGKYNAIVNITDFCKISKDEFGKIIKVDIDDKRLFTLLCTAWLYRKWYINKEPIVMNIPFISTSANIYAKLMLKTLDRKYSIGTEYTALDEALFIFAYFFANYHIGNYKHALDIGSTVKGIIDKRTVLSFIQQKGMMYSNEENVFDSFESLIAMLNASFTHIAKIDAIVFTSAFAQMWGGGSVPGMDYFPYFAMMLFSAYIGGGVVNDIALNATIRADGELIMKQLSETYKI